ncbi:MAG: M56 family metallopeptidase, partial [Myxococcota bacterium]
MSTMHLLGLGVVLGWLFLPAFGWVAGGRQLAAVRREMLLTLALALAAALVLLPMLAQSLVELTPTVRPGASGPASGADVLFFAPTIVVAGVRGVLLDWVARAWVVLGAVALARSLLGHWHWRRVVRQAGEASAALLATLKDRVHVSNRPRVLVSAEISLPVALGIVRPVVLLPRELAEQLSAGQLATILAHECEHLARRDPLRAGLTSLLAAAFFGHPYLSVLMRALVLAREEQVDERVASSHRRSYADLLLLVAELGVGRGRHALATAMAAGPLETRLHRLLAQPRTRHAAPRALALVLLGLLGAAAATWSGCARDDSRVTPPLEADAAAMTIAAPAPG